MSKIKIHAGDFPPASALLAGRWLSMPAYDRWFGRMIALSELESVEIASEESVKRLGGTAGWGLAGAALLGPVGLLAGLLAGGRGKDVTFIAEFKDGRRMLATTDSKTYTSIKAAVF